MNESNVLSLGELILIDEAFKFYTKENLKTLHYCVKLKGILLKLLDLNNYLIAQLKINVTKKED